MSFPWTEVLTRICAGWGPRSEMAWSSGMSAFFLAQALFWSDYTELCSHQGRSHQRPHTLACAWYHWWFHLSSERAALACCGFNLHFWWREKLCTPLSVYQPLTCSVCAGLLLVFPRIMAFSSLRLWALPHSCPALVPQWELLAQLWPPRQVQPPACTFSSDHSPWCLLGLRMGQLKPQKLLVWQIWGLGVQISPLYKNTSHIGLEPTLTTSR